jgi:hypothetical protein
MAWHLQSGGMQRWVRWCWLTGTGHGAGADEMQRWPPFIAVYCVEATWAYARRERGR